MWFEYIWIALTAITIISNKSVSHAQSQNTSESKIKNLRNDYVQKEHGTPNTENLTRVINDENKINTQTLFGDIIANSMNNFLPFSNVNENCTRDGQQFMNALNNQTLWAVKSKYITLLLNI